jgi:hypothetical protein
LQLTNTPYHERFLPPLSKLEMVEDEMIVTKHTTMSRISKRFIRNKQDDSVEKLD